MKKKKFVLRCALVCSTLVACSNGHAGGIQTLDTVEVTAGSEDLIGEASTASEGTVTARQLENRPLLRPAEVLEVVPGLIISQHSGDGKANQYYLRGFNLDHGTDFATTVLGMPVNLPTHAHGQGYSDLNFLIPELIGRMQYRKGTYAAEAGDFATAGSASIDYVRTLPESFAQATVGERGFRRGLVAGSPATSSGNLLYAVEWTQYDGPWTQPERLGKFNALLRLSRGDADNGWSLAALAYRSRWSATDQVPQRAVDGGLISRFGSLDPSDGGNTQRVSLSGDWSSRDGRGWSRANAYAIAYRLDLWSNFTFCATDPDPATCLRGDQFEQADDRRIYGGNAARTWYGSWGGRATEFTLGAQGRIDRIAPVGLYATTARERWATIREDRVDEGSLGLYGEGQVQWHDKFRSIVGLRGDFYRFDVASSLAANSGRVSDHILSPKLALIFGPWARTEYYVNAGYGFHSNDARGTTTTVNPDFRDADPQTGFGTRVQPVTPLVRARSFELGLRSAPAAGLQTSIALWRLDLASELVFVGDAGTTEPSFPSRRTGIEWANFWTPRQGIGIDADLAVSRARYTATDGSVAGDHIPGAIERTASLGATWESGGAWSGGVRLRYFGPRALAEDNSVRSASSTLVNLRIGYRVKRNVRLGIDVLNLFDRQVSDIDYFYASQMRGETAAVPDIHLHPAEPRTLRLSLRIGFG